MSSIKGCFEQLQKDRRKALVGYILDGDPSQETTLPAMHALVDNGVDIIELGVAFSDPMADGPVIQLGHERAVANGASLRSTIERVGEFRKTNDTTPVVLMGYENTIERMGYDTFARLAADAGVDGLISVDLPPEEAGELNAAMKAAGIDNIFLLAPSTTRARAEQILSLASGFVYYVSLKGVTGAGHLDVASVNEKLETFRELTDLPICVGFGIKDGASAKAVTETADGAVVGSLLVNRMGELAGESPETIAAALGELMLPIRQALDHSR